MRGSETRAVAGSRAGWRADESMMLTRDTVNALLRLAWLALVLAMSVPAGETTQAGAPAETLRSIDFLSRVLGKDEVPIVVRGVITLARGSRGYLQDSTGAVIVRVAEPNRLTVGEEVEVAGVYMGRYPHGHLRETSIRRLWSGSPPVPLALSPQNAAEGAFAYRVVETEGRLLSRLVSGRQLLLTLEASGQVFAAALDFTEGLSHSDVVADNLEAGSWLRVSGVCAPNRGQDRQPASAFTILLRTTDDIRVLYDPPWWNLRNISLLSLGALAALWALHRMRVRMLNQRLNAVIEERLRIAREMHDTFAQVFVGMTWQLEALDNELSQSEVQLPARRKLSQALQMLRHGREEAHSSLFALRSLAQDQPQLLDLLARSTEDVVAASGSALELRVEGQPAPLPDQVVGGLLRIGQESVTNAIRHGRARRTVATLRFAPGCVALEISDNGTGFDVGSIGTPAEGHLGILGMRERAQKMRGRLEIRSSTSGGTTVEVTAPIGAPAVRARRSVAERLAGVAWFRRRRQEPA